MVADAITQAFDSRALLPAMGPTRQTVEERSARRLRRVRPEIPGDCSGEGRALRGVTAGHSLIKGRLKRPTVPAIVSAPREGREPLWRHWISDEAIGAAALTPRSGSSYRPEKGSELGGPDKPARESTD
jgi:hypothetical protein